MKGGAGCLDRLCEREILFFGGLSIGSGDTGVYGHSSVDFLLTLHCFLGWSKAWDWKRSGWKESTERG
jgi:hypothetical protein